MPVKITRKYLNLSLDELTLGNGAFILPTTDGIVGQALVTDGLGQVSFQDISSSSSVTATEIAYGDALDEITSDPNFTREANTSFFSRISLPSSPGLDFDINQSEAVPVIEGMPLPGISMMSGADGTGNDRPFIGVFDASIIDPSAEYLIMSGFRNTATNACAYTGVDTNGGLFGSSGPSIQLTAAYNNCGGGMEANSDCVEIAYYDTLVSSMITLNAAGVGINASYILPISDGISGEVITTDGAGNLSFQPGGGGLSLQLYDENPFTPISNTIVGGNAVAIGQDNTVNGNGGMAIGQSNSINTGNNAVAIGLSNSANAAFSVAIGNTSISSGCNAVSIGHCNASGGISAVVLGESNLAKSDYATVGGGLLNGVAISSSYSVVSGGEGNFVNSCHSVIAGGCCNCVSPGHVMSVISGGSENCADSNYAVVVGGSCNTASGLYSTVLNGSDNQVAGCYSIIGGGGFNSITADHGFIMGTCNTVNASTSGAIGRENTIRGCAYAFAIGCGNVVQSTHGGAWGEGNAVCNTNHSFAIGCNITTVSSCTTHVNCLNMKDVDICPSEVTTPTLQLGTVYYRQDVCALSVVCV